MISKDKSISLPLVIVFVIVAAAAFAALGYWEGKKTVTPSNEEVPMPPVPPAPDSSASASATADATANWKTYTNETHGLLVKYPGNLEVITPSDGSTVGVVFKSDDETKSVTLAAIQNVNTYESRKEILEAGGSVSVIPDATYNGYKVKALTYKESGSTLTEVHYFIYKAGNAMQEMSGNSSNSTTMEQMLSTFQFTK